MELKRGSVMRLQEICVPLVLGMDGFSYARIISNGQSRRCAPVLLTFFYKAEGQLFVLLTFLPT